jgi:hypothetical protein
MMKISFFTVTCHSIFSRVRIPQNSLLCCAVQQKKKILNTVTLLPHSGQIISSDCLRLKYCFSAAPHMEAWTKIQTRAIRYTLFLSFTLVRIDLGLVIRAVERV